MIAAVGLRDVITDSGFDCIEKNRSSIRKIAIQPLPACGIGSISVRSLRFAALLGIDLRM